MESTDTQHLAEGAERTAPAARGERARAAAYLDLWERHLSQAAVQGLRTAAPPRQE